MNERLIKQCVAEFVGTFARTFGPGHWNNHVVSWRSPLCGGGLAGLFFGRFLLRPNQP